VRAAASPGRGGTCRNLPPCQFKESLLHALGGACVCERLPPGRTGAGLSEAWHAGRPSHACCFLLHLWQSLHKLGRSCGAVMHPRTPHARRASRHVCSAASTHASLGASAMRASAVGGSRACRGGPGHQAPRRHQRGQQQAHVRPRVWQLPVRRG